MDRRELLTFSAWTAAMAALMTNAEAATPGVAQPDSFERNGWRIHWRDYQAPVNQNVLVGVWWAEHGDPDRMWASTTLGVCQRYRELEVIDMTRMNGWPVLHWNSSDEAKKLSRNRALIALYASLDADKDSRELSEQW